MTRAPSRPALGIGMAMALAAAATIPTLLVGFTIKDRCTTHEWKDGYQYKTSCYNDIYALYDFRGLADGKFPYVGGDGDDEPAPGERFDKDGDLEYPVGTGLFIGAISRMVDGGQAFFRANALALGALAVVASFFLFAMVRDARRVLFFSVGTSLALYAFHNWDLVAVALMCAGLFAFSRGADGWSGMMLGLGAAAKLFPGLLLPGLILARRRQTGRGPARLVIAAVAGFCLLNIPILVINPEAWLYPWRFQSTRFPNFETSWFFVYRHFGSGGGADGFWWQQYPSLTGLVSGGLFALGAGALLFAEAARERIRPYALSLGVLLVFLLTAKVYSPQFALWVLPFFALVGMPWWGFALFALTDAAAWAAISGYFIVFDEPNADRWLTVVEIAVVLRYAVLGLLLWRSRSAEENVAGSPDEAADPARAAPVESPS